MLALLPATLAWGSGTSVFYPLPFQAKGQNLIAKNLYVAPQGGLWLQDMNNQLQFFDGQQLWPQTGTSQVESTSQSIYFAGDIWSFAGNELFRARPGQTRKVATSLPPGAEILRLGQAGKQLWFLSRDSFYFLNPVTGQRDSFSLTPLRQYSNSEAVEVLSAEWTDRGWLLATNHGLFHYQDGQLSLWRAVGRQVVTSILYLPGQDLLLIGGEQQVQLTSFSRPQSVIKHATRSRVTSMTATDRGVWVGTADGLWLYRHSLRQFEPQPLGSGNMQPGTPLGVRALVSDNQQGIWIATDQGILYYSQFSEQFERFPASLFGQDWEQTGVRFIRRRLNSHGYWAVGSWGVDYLELDGKLSRRSIYAGAVNDLSERSGILWLATEQGVVALDSASAEPLPLPAELNMLSVQFIEADSKGLVWGLSSGKLWSYDTRSGYVHQLGQHWLTQSEGRDTFRGIISGDSGSKYIATDHGIYQVRLNSVRYRRDSARFGPVVDLLEMADNTVWVAAEYGVYRFDPLRNEVNAIPLLDSKLSPNCLIVSNDHVWLTSSMGLSQYSREGQLLEHFGAPFGLLNNELLPGVCSDSSEQGRSLLLGSRQGVIKVSSDSLRRHSTPHPAIVLSQVRRNQQVISQANSELKPFEMESEDSLSIQFGLFPFRAGAQLEYRLNSGPWQRLMASELTLIHLLSGDYQLTVRQVSSGLTVEHWPEKTLSFQVKTAWYKSDTVWVILLGLLAALISGLLLWQRHRLLTDNRELKADVALQQSQMRHQSRLLMANNRQLRKQLHIRHTLFDQVISTIEFKLQRAVQQSPLTEQQFANKLHTMVLNELNILRHVRSDGSGSRAVHDLALVLVSVLDSWQEDFEQLGIKIHYGQLQAGALPIELDYFNLDEILNTLFSGLLKRCYRNQSVTLELGLREGQVVLQLIDQGRALETEASHESGLAAGFEWTQLQQAVDKSGGWIRIHSSPARNLTELGWPQGNPFDDNHSELDLDQAEVETAASQQHEPWLEKLEQLVRQHYTDANFGTASAAQSLYMSERSFQRRFKSATGKTFKEHLSQIRLEYACQRLLDGEKVVDVAFACGFNDASYFSQRFKTYFGVSPTRFVESNSESC